MAWRRLARDAAAHLRRGVSPPFVPARTFCASCAPVANPTLLGRHGLQSVWSCYSSSGPAFQARAPMLGAVSFFTARMPLGVRPQLPGIKLLKGFGMGTALAMMLYLRKVADAKEEQPAERPSEDITGPLGYSKHELSELWSLVRKYQLPVGLIVLIALGWQNPIGLVIHILLLLYSSRPNPYSIYLFLQEIHQKEMHQNPAFWKEEFLQTRKVDAEDYKLFTIGTVELKDKRVLHVIGILNSWWIYHVSYVKGAKVMIRNLVKQQRDMAGRNIGVAADFSSCSKAALRWASTNLTRNGDQLILIHVNNSYQNEQGAVHLWEQGGSPLIPLIEFSDPHVTKTYGVSPDKETLEILTQVANQRGIQVVAKIFYGDPAKKLCEAVDLVPLNCMVIGNRGLSTLKRALMGSVSTYIVNHATCPVTVVKENM